MLLTAAPVAPKAVAVIAAGEAAAPLTALAATTATAAEDQRKNESKQAIVRQVPVCAIETHKWLLPQGVLSPINPRSDKELCLDVLASSLE